MQQLPYYPFITRGGPIKRKLTYDAVVFTEDGHYFAEDSNGHIFCQDSQTSCIQEAISYVAQLGGGRISIKSGTYAINSTININNTRQLIIEGEQNTVLEAASNIVMFQVNTGNFPAYPVTPVVEFRHIIFDGNGYNTNAIYVTNRSWQSNIVSCTFRNFQNFAVVYSQAYSHRVLNSIFTNNYGGIYMTNQANDIRIEYTIFEPNSYADVMIEAPAEGITISNCWMEVSSPQTIGHIYIHTVASYNLININIQNIRFYSGTSIYVDGNGTTFDVNVVANYFNATQAINATNVTGIVSRWKIIGNNFNEATQYGINVSKMENSTIVGNFFLAKDSWYGIYGDLYQTAINDNVFMNYGSTTSSTAIYIPAGDLVTIVGNTFLYIVNGIYYGGSNGNDIVVAHNSFEDVTTPISGNPIIIGQNGGYITVNSGQAIISSGSTSVTVNHGLSCTPSKVLITPLGQPSGNLWISNITNTSFAINISTAPSANLSVAWLAEC